VSALLVLVFELPGYDFHRSLTLPTMSPPKESIVVLVVAPVTEGWALGKEPCVAWRVFLPKGKPFARMHIACREKKAQMPTRSEQRKRLLRMFYTCTTRKWRIAYNPVKAQGTPKRKEISPTNKGLSY
jgi:hypothetical protein